jgi:hypothetical protein
MRNAFILFAYGTKIWAFGRGLLTKACLLLFIFLNYLPDNLYQHINNQEIDSIT